MTQIIVKKTAHLHYHLVSRFRKEFLFNITLFQDREKGHIEHVVNNRYIIYLLFYLDSNNRSSTKRKIEMTDILVES